VKLLVDCDPGHDDAVALLVAAHDADLVAITTVNGNAPLHHTTANALAVTQIAGLDVPVHSGAAAALVEPSHHATAVHGDSGFGGVTLPPLQRAVDGTDAVACISDAARRHADLHVVAIGPLTNVALALRADSGLGGRLAGISIMGGGARGGNRTAAAEFNIWADPEAAAVVFGAGVPLRMCGLDLTAQLTVDDEVLAELRAIGTDAALLVADLLGFYCDAYEAATGVRRAVLHDPCAVLALTRPELFTWDERHVEIELTGTHTRGMTVVDERARLDLPPPNCRVMRTIDREGALRAVYESVSAVRGTAPDEQSAVRGTAPDEQSAVRGTAPDEQSAVG
jgi:inosine-uridine nucleoside N-ribohydrolase